MTSASSSRPERVLAIDQYRGLAIMLMVVANYFGGVSGVPNWLKHEPDIGLTAVDLVAPLFIFAIGTTYGLSARRRLQRQGAVDVTWHFVRRYLAIMGIGAFITGVQHFHDPLGAAGWGVLQAIGMAGLLALPLMWLRPPAKLTAGLALLLAYQFVLDRYWVDRVLRSSHGGLPGSLGWGAMLILACGLADLYHASPRCRRLLPLAVLAVGGLGLLVSLWVPVSKNRVSASYVLISAAISAALFLLFHWVLQRAELSLLVAWGQNPLLLYVLHLGLLGAFVLPEDLGWYAMATPTLVALQLMALLAALSALAWWLYRRGVVLAL